MYVSLNMLDGLISFKRAAYNPNSTPIGIQQVSAEIPKGFRLHQNYPNPFNPNTVITFQLSVSSFTKLFVCDILGREVTVLVNEQLKPGTYKVSWNASKNPSGIYYYKLIAGDFSESKRMIIIK
jgi:hypothetical protein